MSTSGFSFSTALASAQSSKEQTSDNQNAPTTDANLKTKPAASPSSGFSFSNALSSAQADNAKSTDTPKAADKPASSGFSFSGALSNAQNSSAATAKEATKPVASGFSFSGALSSAQKETHTKTDKPAATGFSFSGALASKQTKAEITQADVLAADEWQRGEVKLRCIEKWHETHDVVSFRFKGLEPVKFNFKPGQFLTFKLTIDGKTVYRSYTIASSPSRPYSLMITIKRIEGGLVSNHLAEHLNVDDEVTVVGPDGEFNLIDIPADKYLLLSAGSGVTPMHSMSRWLCDTSVDSDIAFVHSAHGSKDVIFADAMASMAQRSAQFSLNYLLREGSETASLSARYDGTQFATGRINVDKLAKLVPDYQSRTVFVCGPQQYMDAVKAMLEAADFNMDNYNQESFGEVPVASNQPKLSASEHKAAGGFMLKVADKEIALGKDQTLLEGIESEGLPIIAACRSGVCGACKCKVTDGTTTSSSKMTLTAAEIEAGYVLACSTKITSDVNLEM